jgi:hypothetical protein
MGYRLSARRERLLMESGVNVVEIDPTRSVKRVVNSPIAAPMLITLPSTWQASPRIIGIDSVIL